MRRTATIVAFGLLWGLAIIQPSEAFQSHLQPMRRSTLLTPPTWRTLKTALKSFEGTDDAELNVPSYNLSNVNDKEQIERSQSFPPTPTLRECYKFIVPALGIYACPPLMSLIDASFIGRTSSVELAALGPAGSISDCAPLPLLFLSIAATNLVAKAYSKGSDTDCARISRVSLGLGSVTGVILGAVLYRIAGPLSFLYCGGAAARSTAETLAPLCAKYVAIRAIALPAVVICTISQAVCIGTKDTKTPMIAVAVAGVLNFLGDLVLVNRMHKGIAGAAWATTLSQFAAAGLLLRVLQKRGYLRRAAVGPVNGSSSSSSSEDTSTRATIMSLLSFVPFLFVMSVKIGMHNACAASAAALGGAPAAAHTALFAVAMLCFTFGDVGSSLSQAFLPAFAFTKDEKGKKEAKTDFDVVAATPTIKQLLKCTFTISTTVVCLSSIIVTLFSGQISRDPSVIQQMRRILPAMIACLSIHGTAVTLEGLLLAQKNFKGLTVTYIGVALSVAGWLTAVRHYNVGLMGIWGCYIWFSGSRILAFSVLGGLLAPLRWSRRFLLYRFIRKLPPPPPDPEPLQ